MSDYAEPQEPPEFVGLEDGVLRLERIWSDSSDSPLPDKLTIAHFTNGAYSINHIGYKLAAPPKVSNVGGDK